MCRKRKVKAKRRNKWQAKNCRLMRDIREMTKAGVPEWLVKSMHGEPAAGEGA